VTDEPEQRYAPERGTSPGSAPRRRAQRAPANSRPESRPEKQQRDLDEDFAAYNSPSGDQDFYPSRRSGAIRLRLRGSLFQIPRTLWGRIFGGVALLVFFATIAAALFFVHSFFLHDERFDLQSASSIQIVGNTHLTREQLLGIFGGDIERNLFDISLAERRAALEQLPWVQRATVMRLLPDHLRVAITERTPVAFVRQGTQIGLVDASGVLLDMPPDAPGDPQYSFPVITGINATDPLSTRAARMKIYTRFTTDLDSTGEKISTKLSEIDLSDPEDVKALIPEGWADILVHFGETGFLARYQKFQQLLPEWRTQYPKLASVDMRYDRQVVLEMQPGAPGSGDPNAAANSPGKSDAKSPAKSDAKPSTGAAAKMKKLPAKPKSGAKPVKKAAAKPASGWHPTAASSHTVAATSPSSTSSSASNPATAAQPKTPHPLQQAAQH
jgi:cell division protein FtsQ